MSVRVPARTSRTTRLLQRRPYYSWACPPSEGDDYIFHCHPPEQKIPKPKRLQDWYKRMLDKGRTEDIVFEYKDILKQARDDDLQSPAHLPVFEGDFWPNMVSGC